MTTQSQTTDLALQLRRLALEVGAWTVAAMVLSVVWQLWAR